MKRISSIIISMTLLFISSTIFSATKGVILGDRMNIRKKAKLQSKVIANLRIGTTIQILQHTKKSVKIGKLNDSWIKIKTHRRGIGYIFGAYLYNLAVLYNKKWQASSPSGDSFYEYHFKKNGRYVCKINYPHGSPGYYKDTIYGVYKRKGAVLILRPLRSIKKQHSKKTYKIYLYKKNLTEMLSFTKYSIGQKNIVPFELLRMK